MAQPESNSVRISACESVVDITAGAFRRRWSVDASGLRTTCVEIAGEPVALADTTDAPPECSYDGLTQLPRQRGSSCPELQLLEVACNTRPADELDTEREEATLCWHEPGQDLHVARTWSVYPNVDVMVCQAGIRSQAVPQAQDEWKQEFDNVVETLPVCLVGWEATAVAFFARTDYHNEYVREKRFVIEAGTPSVAVTGNLLFLHDPTTERGFIILHESPPDDEKRPECSATFRVGPDGVQILGWGIRPHEILPDRARQSYCVAIGVYTGGARQPLELLRRYLKTRFPLRPEEQAVVANPWGDGHCYERFSEAFLLSEIEAAAEIGATHYQIDDGWQAGGILADLTCANRARAREYWDVHPGKLPDGFTPLAECATAHGVELALWFAPDVARGYRNWEEDRDVLLDVFRRYGIRLVKIDGIRVYSKDSEEYLLNLLEGVIRGSGGRMRLNLDVTNGLRLGYFTSQRFGTIFVENRYVSINPENERYYYPWRVLRNLWQLSRYVPPEKLQFEFANRIEASLNDAAEAHRDSPQMSFKISWEYLCAVPLLASPLCWLQPSRLPAEARAAVRGVMDLHHRIAPELRTAFTFPIGEEPSGRGWTGFWSARPDLPHTGLVQVFREHNDRAEAAIALDATRLPPGTALRLQCLSHTEPDVDVVIDATGAVTFTVPTPNAFRLYRYAVVD